MDDRTLAQKKTDLARLWNLISDQMDVAAKLAREINEEEERRKDHPGTVHEFRPRPSDGAPDA